MYDTPLKAKNNSSIFWFIAILIAIILLIVFVQPVRSVFLGAQTGGGGGGGGGLPGVPTLNTPTASNGQVALTWTAPSSSGSSAITGYKIRYSASGVGQQAISTNSTNTSYTVTGLNNGTQYTFAVAAINSTGQGSFSNSQTATPSNGGGGGGGATVPGAPVLDTATAGDSEIDLEWTAPASDGGSSLTGYLVSFTPDGGAEELENLGVVTSHTLTGLTNDTEYTIKVRAKNTLGPGTWSNSLTATPAAPSLGPSAPSITSIASGDQTIDLEWSAPSENNGSPVTGYVITYRVGGSDATVSVGNVTSYSLTGLTNGSQYTLRLQAENGNGLSDYSASQNATPSTTPGTPTNVSLIAGDGTLAVTWTAPASTGGAALSGYTISYTPSGGNESTIAINDGNSTSYTIEDLTNGISYAVKVRASNIRGNGSYSTSASGTPDESIAPTIVGSPSVTPSRTSAVITWSTNKSASTKVDFGLLTTTRSTPEYNTSSRVVNHTVTITGLLPCTTYSYKVISYDGLAQSATSATRNFTTTGCVVTAQVQEIKRDSVDTTVGGVLDFTDTDVKTKLTVPQNLKAGQEEMVFQVKMLEKESTQTQIGLPDPDVSWLGNHVYNLSAYEEDGGSEVNDFDEPLTVTMEYTSADIAGIDINTLVIHHYDEDDGWSALTQCTNTYDATTGTGQISCPTDSFSIFGLFGEQSSSTTTTGVYIPDYLEQIEARSSAGTSTSIEDGVEEMVVEDVVVQEEVSEEIEDAVLGNIQISRDLWRGISHPDVLVLQKFLNQNGFILAKDGPGAPGKETTYFGPRTFSAIQNFQTFYHEAITALSPLHKASGYVDYFTRQFIEENF